MTPRSASNLPSKPVPARAGIGLRADHYQIVLETQPDIGWLEVHSENYFGDGGKPIHYLDKISEHYPISLHGVGLSIGSADELNLEHLKKLQKLIERYQPGLVSEHLSWGSFQGKYYNDLFPMPYTPEALQHMIDRVSQIQDFLGRQILIENVSSYLQFDCSTLPEWEFLTELANHSECGILLDINNIYVNACNHGFDANTFINAIPNEFVKEMHLAGHTVKTFEDTQILIDTHNKRVTDDVWSLYRTAFKRFGDVPTLIEWDTDLPTLDVLLDEASKVDDIINESLTSDQHTQHYEHIA